MFHVVCALQPKTRIHSHQGEPGLSSHAVVLVRLPMNGRGVDCMITFVAHGRVAGSNLDRPPEWLHTDGSRA